MPRLIAFLRGINVGGHRVKMDDLRRHFTALKLRDVETFIASGNVIFTATPREAGTLEPRIEAHLEKTLGYAVPTMVRTLPELAAVAAQRPFTSADMDDPNHSLNVMFLRTAPSREVVQALAALEGKKDAFHVHGRELYWLCRGKISVDSLAAPLMGKALKGTEGTVRNLRTVQQLVALYPAPPAKSASVVVR